MQCTIFAGSSFKVRVIDAIFYVWDLQCRYTNNVVQILWSCGYFLKIVATVQEVLVILWNPSISTSTLHGVHITLVVNLRGKLDQG